MRSKNECIFRRRKPRSLLGKVIVPILGQTLRLAVPLLGVILLLPLLKLPENWIWVTQKGVGILLIVALSVLIVHGVNALQLALLSRNRLDAPDNLSARRIYTQVSVIRKIIITAVVIIAAGSILMLFDPVRQFGTSILASAGIAGVIIGFAAQKTLGNVLAGIQIALTQPILIDDIVVVEGEFGQIEEIALTYVTVRTWDLRRLVLPITYFIEKPFQNWSRVSTELFGTVILYLDYQVPLGELRKELKRLVENNPKWDRKVCGLQVTDTKVSTIEVRCLVSGTDPGKTFDLRCEVREGLIEFLRREYPESLPRVRNVDETSAVKIHRQKKIKRRRGPERQRTRARLKNSRPSPRRKGRQLPRRTKFDLIDRNERLWRECVSNAGLAHRLTVWHKQGRESEELLRRAEAAQRLQGCRSPTRLWRGCLSRRARSFSRPSTRRNGS